MSTSILMFLVAVIAALGWAAGRSRALSFRRNGARLHSLPGYHATHVALSAAIPGLLLIALWTAISPRLIVAQVIASPAGRLLPAEPEERTAMLADTRALADDAAAVPIYPDATRLAPLYRAARTRFGAAAVLVVALLSILSGSYGYRRLRPDFRARNHVERFARLGLLFASLIAIVTTIGIVASLLLESILFFSLVAPFDFLLGTRWSPQAATNGDMAALGAVPLFWGTIFIGAIIAMLVAIPLGLMSAIYLTQYAGSSMRRWMKPLLEILAGIPTVVYGYFAALTVAPIVRVTGDALGVPGTSAESALAAGLVMGVMIVPFVSSMADDALAAVPQAMRDGSLAMGATKSETIRRVLVPAALPGIVGGVLLAISRAIGETMIVVMAAGFAANLTANPFASVTTVTVQIVQLLTGDQEFDSAKTLSAFALGLTLFVVTLLLNIVALRVVRRYREAYD